jgi:predicted 3-demethylubiquinone-9 3-methyltransferase (glyoxalase superfamily)
MQNIDSFLWFENDTEEAVNFYTGIFKNSKVFRTSRYNEESAKASGIPNGSVMVADFQLSGRKFVALNGGPVEGFTFNPSTSFFVNCGTEEEINNLFQKLASGGKILMPLDKYPFSEKYAWINDKFGVSWQLDFKNHKQSITPFLWFKNQAEEAMNYYIEVFSALDGNKSGIIKLQRFGDNANSPAEKIQFARFSLNGQEFIAMDNNHEEFTPAISFSVNCETQKEVDELWEKLSAGGTTSQCGWLTDKFGVTWQIVPIALGQLISDPDPDKSRRVMKAMLKMTKLDIAGLQRAYENN